MRTFGVCKFFSALIAFAAMPGIAQAALVISKAPTSNVTCAAGVCTAVAADAVLNVKDLKSLLRHADLRIVSGSAAQDIAFNATLNWTQSTRLTLDAYRSIAFTQPVTAEGPGAVTLTTNDGGAGGDYMFTGKGKLAFWDVSSSLIINGTSFTLVGDIATLANDVSGNASGRYALARDYDAAPDGTYSKAPITKDFQGTLEGLGNGISRLSIDDETPHNSIGLFAVLGSAGLIRDIGLSRIRFTAGNLSHAGGLAGQSLGAIANAFVTGSIRTGDGDGKTAGAGGLVGYSTGSIVKSHAAVSLDVGAQQIVGGLAGENSGIVSDSHASGAIKAAAGVGYVGGFVAINHPSGTITRCHATGNVAAGKEPIIGSFMGSNFGTITQSYALGSVIKAGLGASEAGFSGFNASGATITQSYSRGDVSGSGGNKTFDDATGGFVAFNLGAIVQSYSTGAPSAGDRGTSYVGGLLGFDGAAPGSLVNTYWDLDTSGIADPARGAGDPPNDPGITGLTSSQFKSGLPAGFDSNVWGQNAAINDGYPYLLANPPEK